MIVPEFFSINYCYWFLNNKNEVSLLNGLFCVKDKDGKWVHHTDFKDKHEETDAKTGKKKTVWKDKPDLTDDQKELKHKSEHEDHHQKCDRESRVVPGIAFERLGYLDEIRHEPFTVDVPVGHSVEKRRRIVEQLLDGEDSPGEAFGVRIGPGDNGEGDE